MLPVVKGEDVTQPGIPQSFHVLMKELQSLGLSIELENDDRESDDSEVNFAEDFALKNPLALLEGDEDPTDEEQENSNEEDQPIVENEN